MLSSIIKVYKEHIMIADVFPENGISLIYGASGIGKTITTIKHLNDVGITPIHFDLDSNIDPKEFGIDVIHIDGNDIIRRMADDEQLEPVALPAEGVMILDTWQLLSSAFGEESYAMRYAKKLRDNGMTVIIIGHENKHKNDRDNPDMSPEYANHLDAKLWFHTGRAVTTGKDKSPATYNLKVVKLRGYKGEPIIYEWRK